MRSLNLFYVYEGQVKKIYGFESIDQVVSLSEHMDWANEALCYCASTKEALELFELFDSNKIQPDNVSYYGRVIVALKKDKHNKVGGTKC